LVKGKGREKGCRKVTQFGGGVRGEGRGRGEGFLITIF